MNGSILVTGAAGMIGSVLVAELNRRGYGDVIAVDRLGTSAKWENLAALSIVDYWEADELTDRLEHGALRDIGTVFHLGACSSTTEEDGSYLMRNNFGYTKRLAEWAVQAGVRFVYASSAATYGALERGLTEGLPLCELRPLNRYGYSKQLFDVYAEKKGLLRHIAGLKYFNIFGPHEHHKGGMRSMVHKAFHQIQETGKVQLFKSYRPEIPNGGQQRDFLYVKDAVDATIFFGENQSAGIFNIGSGIPHTWVELITPIFQALGREPTIEFIEMPEALRAQYQYFTCADLTKLRATGYPCRWTPLEEAVRDYVTNHLVRAR